MQVVYNALLCCNPVITARQHCVNNEDMHAQLRQQRLLSYAMQQQMLQLDMLACLQ